MSPEDAAAAAARSTARQAHTTIGATLVCAAALSAIAFVAGGGLSESSMTGVEMALTIGAGLLAAALLLTGGATPARSPRRPLYGITAALLLLAFTAWTALSVAWSVEPDASWQDAGRMFAYFALFVAAAMLARYQPGRWRAVLGGITLAAVVVSGYALLTKVFPAQLDPADTYARLQQPYGYWIATGLAATIGVLGCMWLAARRDGHALWRALAYPAIGIELVTLMLTYSRGPLAALVVGLVVWFAIVPLRLRGAAVLLTGAAGAAGVVAFDFATKALSSEGAALPERVTAGHQLGVLLVFMLLALTGAGLAIGFLTGRRAPRPRLRRGAGSALLGAIALAILLAVGALALSQRGLTGTISHDFNTLTNPNAQVPANTPGRLTAIANVRARYWKEALQIFDAHPLLGAGAEGYATARLRYRTETLDVRHAHGFVVQTLADLGLVGLVLALLLLGAWARAAQRTTQVPPDHRLRGLLRRGPKLLPRTAEAPTATDAPPLGARYTAERIGMLCMLTVVVAFGAHSLVDWTWYVPGDAAAALLCAGWLAGRGPLAPAADERAATVIAGDTAPLTGIGTAGADTAKGSGTGGARLLGRLRGLPAWRPALAGIALAASLLAAYTQWQPQRAASASEHALALVATDPSAALSEARSATDEDPLSPYGLRVLAAIEERTDMPAAAEATLREAVRREPSNPQTWAALGEHDLLEHDYRDAANELRAAVYLDPEIVAPEAVIADNPELLPLRNDYLEALRMSGAS